MNATSYPPITPETLVRTTQKNPELRNEWTKRAQALRKWGVEGTVVGHSDSHGLCYEVFHRDGTTAYYDPSEIQEVKLLIPETETPWTKKVREMKYPQVVEFIPTRPIVAWFSSRKRTIHQLYKMTARQGDDKWILMGHNYDEEREIHVMIVPTELHIVLRYLPFENEWTLCEFKNGKQFHSAVLAYLGG